MHTNFKNPPTRRRLACCAAALCLLAVLSAPAHAWGWEGHHIVMRIAEKRLSPAARQRIQSLLANESQADDCDDDFALADDSSAMKRLLCGGMWPDESRRTTHKKTYNWHFVDISLEERNYDAARDCEPHNQQSKGKCGLFGLDRALQIARGDISDPNITRSQALMFVLHVVGDLHQPLHTVLEGGGGNTHNVVYFDIFTDMHKVWDTKIIESQMIREGMDVRGYADALAQQVDAAGAASFAEDDRERWVLEAHAAAIDTAYGQRPQQKTATHNGRKYHSLRTTYFNHGLPVVEQQLKRGGVRLANLLNRTFN